MTTTRADLVRTADTHRRYATNEDLDNEVRTAESLAAIATELAIARYDRDQASGVAR